MALSTLKPQRTNANRHTPRGMKALEESIQKDGWIGAVTVAADGESFDGSARLEVGVATGFEDAIVVESDGSKPVVLRRTDIPSANDPRAVRLGVAANRVAELNLDWDASVISELAEQDGLLDGLFNDDELDALLASIAQEQPVGAGGDDFDTTPDEGQTRVQYGDLWELGRHRLLCGDSTVAADVERLMGGERADMVFIDPPYAIYGSSTGAKNDANMIVPFFREVWTVIAGSHAKEVYMCCDWRSLPTISTTCKGYDIKDVIVWDKGSGGLGNPYRRRHEFLLFARPASSDKVMFRGGRGVRPITDDDVWLIPRDPDKQHNAQKPLELVTRAINNSSDVDACVFDFFLGSGTTLIAAERTGRRCYGLEIEPRYVNVCLSRWEAETGKEARRIDG